MFIGNHTIMISGLTKLAADLPDHEWYQLRVYLRKSLSGGGADVKVSEKLRTLDGVYEADGDLWFRDKNDELQIVD